MPQNVMVSANQTALAPKPEPISNTVRGRSSPISAGYMAKSNTFFIIAVPRQRISEGAPWQVSCTSTPNSVPNRGW